MPERSICFLAALLVVAFFTSAHGFQQHVAPLSSSHALESRMSKIQRQKLEIHHQPPFRECKASRSCNERKPVTLRRPRRLLSSNLALFLRKLLLACIIFVNGILFSTKVTSAAATIAPPPAVERTIPATDTAISTNRVNHHNGNPTSLDESGAAKHQQQEQHGVVQNLLVVAGLGGLTYALHGVVSGRRTHHHHHLYHHQKSCPKCGWSHGWTYDQTGWATERKATDTDCGIERLDCACPRCQFQTSVVRIVPMIVPNHRQQTSPNHINNVCTGGMSLEGVGVDW